MTTTDKIALFSAFGGWLSAIATFAAVCVSLHIANRRPKISISCNVAETYTQPLPTEVAAKFSGRRKLRFITAKITNHSNFAVQIYGVGLQIKSKVDFLRYAYDWDEFPLPQSLSYGEDQIIVFSDNAEEWINGMRAALKSNNLKPEKIRCSVTLSTRETFYFPLDEKLLASLQYR